ncbi:hypothetical protein LINPERHAP1_LOCUS35381 [Linum perenne]
MIRTLARLRRDIRKSPRVADESTMGGTMTTMTRVGGGGGGENQHQQHVAHTLNKFTTVVSLVLSPFSMFLCLSQPRVNGADRMWASMEVPRSSEANNHLIALSDGMRYAIPM